MRRTASGSSGKGQGTPRDRCAATGAADRPTRLGAPSGGGVAALPEPNRFHDDRISDQKPRGSRPAPAPLERNQRARATDTSSSKQARPEPLPLIIVAGATTGRGAGKALTNPVVVVEPFRPRRPCGERGWGRRRHGAASGNRAWSARAPRPSAEWWRCRYRARWTTTTVEVIQKTRVAHAQAPAATDRHQSTGGRSLRRRGSGEDTSRYHAPVGGTEKNRL